MAKKTEPTPTELKIKEQFVANMQRALAAHESNNKYDAQNPTSTAAGKYQFTKMWLREDGKVGEKSIQAFAKRNGMPVPQSLDEFKTMPVLQDAYFKYYAKEVLYPKALEAIKSPNPKGVTMEQAGALVHLRGEGVAIKEISTGNFSKPTKAGVDGAKHTNPSSISYMNSIAAKIGQPITPEQLTAAEIETMPQAEKDKIAKDYFTKKDQIIHFKDLDEVDKNRQIAQLNSEYKAKGYIPIVNDHLTKQNKKNTAEAKAKDDQIRKDVAEYQKWGEKTRLLQGGQTQKTEGTISLSGPDEAKEFKKWAKDNGVKISEKSNFMFSFNAHDFDVAGVKALAGKKDITQKEVDQIIKAAKGDNENILINDSLQKGDVLRQNNFRKIASFFTGEKAQRFGASKLDPEAVAYAQNLNSATTLELLDETQIADLPRPETEPLVDDTEATPDQEAAVATTTEDPNSGGLAAESDDEGLSDQWAKNLAEDVARKNAEGEEKSYNKSDFKREIPVDFITGLAVGITGMKQAKDVEVPMRTEEVSEAYRNIASELAKKSKEGLPPAVEAAMKHQLAEGLQGGLANITNASNGNRALVLGNLGGLEKSKAQGIIDMKLADYEAKERAFEQYGEAVKYQNDFKARKDVANHSIKYNEALKRRSDGEELAAAGFKQMIEGLKYQKDNGPGSINHMKKSWLEQEMFGFALDAKADAPNSYESFQKRKAADKEYMGLQLEGIEKKASLDDDQKKVFDQFLETGASEKDSLGFLNYLYANPDKKRMDPTRFAEAKERGDFGLMFAEATPEAISITPEKMISPAITQLEQMRPGIPGRVETKPVATDGLAGGIIPSPTSIPELPAQQDPTDFDFALTKATEDQLSYYNNQ